MDVRGRVGYGCRSQLECVSAVMRGDERLDAAIVCHGRSSPSWRCRANTQVAIDRNVVWHTREFGQLIVRHRNVERR